MQVHKSRGLLQKNSKHQPYYKVLNGQKLKRFKLGQMVAIVLEPRFKKTSLSHRHHGQVGMVTKILSPEVYEVYLKKTYKKLIARNVHLKEVIA